MAVLLRQLPLLTLLAGVCAAGALAVASAAHGSSFPGMNGKLVYVVNNQKAATYLTTANADGSGQTQITSPTAKAGDMEPRFSADGTKVVFIRDPKPFGYLSVQLWTAGADGSHAHQVTITGLPSGTYPLAPTFTPDGATIVFELDNVNAPIGIWKVAAAGGKATRLTNGNDYQPAVSPDGKKLAFIRGTHVEVANVNGSSPVSLYAATETSIDEPDFSPYGSKIVFEQLKNGIWDIWTVPTAGGSAKNLTRNTASSSSVDPAFSPDGTKIAFAQVDNSTYATTIDEMSAAGGTATAVVKPHAGTSVRAVDWAVLPKK